MLYLRDKNYQRNDMKRKLNIWKENLNDMTFRYKDKIVTFEDLEKYKGKHNEVTDMLLEAIFIIKSVQS